MEFAAIRTLLAIPEEKRTSRTLEKVCGGPFAPYAYAAIDASPAFKLMDALQQAHDDNASRVTAMGEERSREQLACSLRQIAVRFDLTFPIA